jgi:hypothetical protein
MTGSWACTVLRICEITAAQTIVRKKITGILGNTTCAFFDAASKLDPPKSVDCPHSLIEASCLLLGF